MCGKPLPTADDRKKHVAETKHCACPECHHYTPPAHIYDHWCVVHDDIHWNDHMIACCQKTELGKAMPWVRRVGDMNGEESGGKWWREVLEKGVYGRIDGGENMKEKGRSFLEKSMPARKDSKL